MATDRASLKIQEASALGSFATGGTAVSLPGATVSLAHSDSFSSGVKSADDAMASTTTAETGLGISIPAAPTILGSVARAFQVNQILYTPLTGAITNDNTNNAVITVSARLSSTGGSAVVLGTLTTSVTALGATIAQWSAVAFTLTTANLLIAAGATLTFSIAKGGSGVVVRGGTITVDGEWV